MTRHLAVLVAVCVAVAGCASRAPPVDTGSRTAVQTYFDALVRRDWPAAYAVLHPDSRKRLSLEQFKRAAENHRHALGFEPEEARLKSCEEHDADATAHVLLTGSAGGKKQTAKDAVALKHSDAGWGVVLPQNFGGSRGR
jgi:hypothetical protein